MYNGGCFTSKVAAVKVDNVTMLLRYTDRLAVARINNIFVNLFIYYVILSLVRTKSRLSLNF